MFTGLWEYKLWGFGYLQWCSNVDPYLSKTTEIYEQSSDELAGVKASQQMLASQLAQ